MNVVACTMTMLILMYLITFDHFTNPTPTGKCNSATAQQLRESTTDCTTEGVITILVPHITGFEQIVTIINYKKLSTIVILEQNDMHNYA